MHEKWEYSSAPESTTILQLRAKYGLFMNGVFVAPKSNVFFTSFNPATNERIAEFAYADAVDVDIAVQAAKSCYENEWSKLSGLDRGKYLFRIARIMQERSRELAIAESLDGGKPIRESRDFDIPLASNHFFYYAGWADKLSSAFQGQKVNALGVVGQIIPWNFPLLMAAWKIAPALATGNTVVLKAAESTPLTALILADILREADLPKGAVNILTGDGITGAALVEHVDVRKIAFTGSTHVGKWVQKTVAGSTKKLTLELGGKSANIVLEDCAMDETIEGIVNGIFFNQGHVCCAGSRLLVQESISTQFITKLKDRMKTLIVGDPLDKNTDIGAINSEQQYISIQNHIAQGIEEGNEIFQTTTKIPEKGYFIPPTLFTNVAQSSCLSQQEIFGPVLAIQTFRTLEEAIQKANNTPYGLAAGVWTTNGSRAFGMASQLKAGVVWANTYNKFDPSSPFGGYKESGFGREGGVHGLAAYLEVER